jgi:hypothetical protein
MTRVSGYDLIACPSCAHVHRKTFYSSVSVYIPDDTRSSDDRACVNCGEVFALNEFEKVGYVSRFTKDEQAERVAWTLYSLGQGPRPETKPPEPFLLRSWLALKARFTPEVPKPWDKYPPLA